MRASVGQFFLTFRNWFISLIEHLALSLPLCKPSLWSTAIHKIEPFSRDCDICRTIIGTENQNVV